MSEELVIEAPSQTTVFDGFSDVDLSTIKPKEEIIEPEQAPDGLEVKKEPVIEKKEEPIIEVKKEEPVIEKKPEPEPFKYEALEPTKIKELYAIIDKKEKLTDLLNGEVTKDNAPEIIKAQWNEKYKGLTKQQMDYKFNKTFSVPKAPVQGETELDDDFTGRQEDWKEQVANAEMDMLIEANLARPELEKINSELKLPEIARTEQNQKEPTSEELATAQKGKDLFVQNADAAVKKFEGFNVDYKDKDVNIKSTYALSDEEKASVLGKMKLLAEKNYNSNAVFAERWVNDDKTFNFDQIAKDIAILETHDKAGQKLTGDAYAKAKLNFIKDKHQIDLGGSNGNGDLQLEDKEDQKKKEDALWA